MVTKHLNIKLELSFNTSFSEEFLISSHRGLLTIFSGLSKSRIRSFNLERGQNQLVFELQT